jgi:hypothetical protein
VVNANYNAFNYMHRVVLFLIASVWLVNGLFCKVLNLVPRHEQIVARILGQSYARPMTILIGIAEVGMAVWIISRFKPRLSVALQIAVIGMMNILEFVLVPDLLLWGRFNIVFALLFITVVYLNEYRLQRFDSQA